MNLSRLCRATIAAWVLLAGSAAAQAAGQTIQPVAGARAAPGFVLKDLNDKARRLEDYRGKVVAVNFWATWCPPCRKELPSMQRTYAAFKDRGFAILAVNVGENWETVTPFLQSFALEFPVLLDPESQVIEKWSVMGLPTTFIVDRKGRITHRINGGRDWDDPAFRKELEEIIGRKP